MISPCRSSLGAAIPFSNPDSPQEGFYIPDFRLYQDINIPSTGESLNLYKNGQIMRRFISIFPVLFLISIITGFCFTENINDIVLSLTDTIKLTVAGILPPKAKTIRERQLIQKIQESAKNGRFLYLQKNH